MFNIPVDAITIDDVTLFCRSGVRENVILDFKKEFPAKLEKTLAAFANTYGGMILIGVDETPVGAAVLPIMGTELRPGLREQIIQKAISAIYPPILPEVAVIEFKSEPTLAAPNRAVVVVRVHESYIGSHAIDNRTTVYIRVANTSEPFRKATLEEIELFRNKKELAVAARTRSIDIATERARRSFIALRDLKSISTSEPAGRFRLWSIPTFPKGPLVDVRTLRDAAVNSIVVPGLAMPTIPVGNSTPIASGVSFDSLSNDWFYYSEVHDDGLAYHEFGFWWDNQVNTKFVPSKAVAHLLMAGLFYGVRLYGMLGHLGLVDYHFEMDGVEGRMLCESPSKPSPFYCRDKTVLLEIRETVPRLSGDIVGRCKEMLRDVFWAFGGSVNEIDLDPLVQSAANQVLER